ncbi:modulation of CheA activity in response to attractants [Ligilactobacillus salitolerans]|uniref:Modulation of CheA activity in response to attractants n=1 Tax=Ligilactobacillus salitolerans TaxID=1808352 RepID=A0A401ITP9_9LACO|nr:chemotaxis protein CheW [Ligilactobacillus salitolerans]GBG94912.1 modulation of CheA activity in response to attractants [Ligilactobacillus salitolerans]
MGQYVVFKSHQQLFALPVEIVKRVIETEKFISLPEVPDYILGVYEYQEQMLPIVDLCKKLYNNFSPVTVDSKVILSQWKGRTMGIFVEEIIGIIVLQETDYAKDLDKAALKHPYISKFLKMENEEVVIDLNLNYLFNDEQEAEIVESLEAAPAESGKEENTEDAAEL